MRDLTVGIDIGTTAVKALAVDPAGAVVGRARAAHGFRTPTPNRLEHDAVAAWRDGPLQALEELGEQGITPDRLAGICVAAMVPSLAAVDSDGTPTTPGLLYGDERGRTDRHASGPMSSAEGQAFLRWTAGVSPDAVGYWPAQAVANRALGGGGVIDVATASALSPLFDGTGWNQDEVAAAGAEISQLPEVVPLGQPVAEVQGAALASGSVDALGEQAVAGVSEPGEVLVVLGSTLLVWAVVDQWTEIPRLWSIPHTVAGRFLVGGASNAGGLFRDWALRLVAAGRDTGAGVGEVDAGALRPEGIPVWEPYPRGERTPLHDPDRRAVLHGLDLTHGPGEVVRAVHEATGFVVRRHLELAGIDAHRLVVSGGGARSHAWVQAVSDATGVPADVVAVPEGGALGAAWMARMAAGLETVFADASRWAATAHRVEPDRTWVAAMADRYARFVELTS